MRPFTGIPKGSRYSWLLMGPRPTSEMERGRITVPVRDPHPAFNAFNFCDPGRAASLRLRIVHWHERSAWRFNLGVWQAPQGHEQQARGWWCRGDGERASRWQRGQQTAIRCPGQLCEFAQLAGDKGPLCKPHLTLLGRLQWADGSPLPPLLVQWSSQSWNNAANVEGVFRYVRELAANLGLGEGFPVFGLPLILTVGETRRAARPGQSARRFPEVAVSIDGDPMEWLSKLRAYIEQQRDTRELLGSMAEPLQLAPPAGMTSEDVDRVSQAALAGEYRPANERNDGSKEA